MSTVVTGTVEAVSTPKFGGNGIMLLENKGKAEGGKDKWLNTAKDATFLVNPKSLNKGDRVELVLNEAGYIYDIKLLKENKTNPTSSRGAKGSQSSDDVQQKIVRQNVLNRAVDFYTVYHDVDEKGIMVRPTVEKILALGEIFESWGNRNDGIEVE